MRSGKKPDEMDWSRLGKDPPDRQLAADIMGLEGPDLQRLRRLARSMTGSTVTYSRNVTAVVTELCRNRCSYCGFRKPVSEFSRWRDLLPVLRRAEDVGCCEVLFMSGERPEEVDAKARRFLAEVGFGSTPDYVAWLCGRTLDETGLLPHTNVGVLDADEIARLKEVNASLGLMLENTSERLCGPGLPHGDSPGKLPSRRLETIAEAGRQGVPFTTGILVGIGETDDELLDSLMTIRNLSQEHGHIQEVIVQRFLPKPSTPMASHPTASRERVLHLVSAARLILGSQIHVQVPPNIEVNYEESLLSGADDLGGISPITRDRINPEAPWCGEHEIINRVSSLGLRAKPRPPVYPEYVEPEFLAPRLLERTRSWLRKLDGGRLP